MKTTLVNVRIPDTLYLDAKLVTEAAGYANMQELIKEAIRNKISEIKKEMSLFNLDRSLRKLDKGKKKILAKNIKEKVMEERINRVKGFIDKVRNR